MADIAPFRGLRYNLDKIRDLSRVVIPPYDVISPQEQKQFHEISPHNMVRLELGMATSHDNEKDNPHARAAGLLDLWTAEGIFLREDVPSIYYYELDYDLPGKPRQTRCGYICALRLEDFKSGRVRPHEKTFQAVKDERLALMRLCQANLSPVFALYADPGQEADRILKEGRVGSPTMAFTDDKGMEHRVWSVRDPELLCRVIAAMRDKTLFIADGHHRYETALNFRNLQRSAHPHAGPHASFEFIMVYLSNMNQEGLTILPTHRVLKNVGDFHMEDVIEKASEFFEISSCHQDRVPPNFPAQGGACRETVMGLLSKTGAPFFMLKARSKAIHDFLAGEGIAPELRSLDVVILDHILLKNLSGFSDSFLANEHNIHFKHDFHDALTRVKSGEYDLGFFINPTRIEQVQEVAGAGLIMPHKSTYFYPKVGSGLVVRLLPPEEKLSL